jgi:hypothetical protein
MDLTREVKDNVALRYVVDRTELSTDFMLNLNFLFKCFELSELLHHCATDISDDRPACCTAKICKGDLNAQTYRSSYPLPISGTSA